MTARLKISLWEHFRRWVDREGNRRLLFWLLAGLLLRMLIMPFFCHADFLSEYRRVYMTIETGDFFPQYTRLVVYYSELLFLFLSLPILGSPEALLSLTDLTHSTASLLDYYLIVSDPHIFSRLFFLKIPYLLFDLGTAVLIYRMMEGKKTQLAALNLWLFNPVTLYAFYLFGRYESISIFFLALSLYGMQKKKIGWAAVALGMALNAREINIIFVPLFFLAVLDDEGDIRRNAARILSTGIIVAGLFFLPQLLSRLFDIQPLYRGINAIGTDRSAHIFDFQHKWLLPFVFTYFCICFWLLETRGEPFFKMLKAWGLSMLAFFFFTSHSAHYVSWLMIFPVFMLFFRSDMLKPTVLLCCTWVALWLFATDRGVFTPLLASPLSLYFLQVPSVPKLYTQSSWNEGFFHLDIVILILNNLFHAGLAYVAYKWIRTSSSETQIVG